MKKIQEFKLSRKIRIAGHPQKTVKFSEKRLRFYSKYATFVYRTLRKPLFQKFLNWVIKREKIEDNMVEEVQVRVFPFRKENGKALAGRWSNKGKVLIYPKSLDFLRKVMRGCKKKKVCFYIESRAKATLIHELLHAKYEDNEDKVRELTKKYFTMFMRHKKTQNTNAHNVMEMLFPN